MQSSPACFVILFFGLANFAVLFSFQLLTFVCRTPLVLFLHLSPTPGGAEPRPYDLPRKKGKTIWFSTAPSIDGNCSKATGCKSDTPVSGGAQYDARKVTIVRNARRKHRFQPKIRCRKHQTANRICGLGFSMQICSNLSVSLRLTAPLPGEPWVMCIRTSRGRRLRRRR